MSPAVCMPPQGPNSHQLVHLTLEKLRPREERLPTPAPLTLLMELPVGPLSPSPALPYCPPDPAPGEWCLTHQLPPSWATMFVEVESWTQSQSLGVKAGAGPERLHTCLTTEDSRGEFWVRCGVREWGRLSLLSLLGQRCPRGKAMPCRLDVLLCKDLHYHSWLAWS